MVQVQLAQMAQLMLAQVESVHQLIQLGAWLPQQVKMFQVLVITQAAAAAAMIQAQGQETAERVAQAAAELVQVDLLRQVMAGLMARLILAAELAGQAITVQHQEQMLTAVQD